MKSVFGRIFCTCLLYTSKAAEPQRIAFEDLAFHFGERWIPTGVYAAYMSRLFDTEVKIA